MKHGIFMAIPGRILTAALLFFTFSANAQNITYQVDRAFGGGTIVGTIETDGTLGALSQGNIVAWSFEAFDGVDTFQMSSANGWLQGDAWGFLSATPTQLIFDFDDVNASGLSEKFITFHGDGGINNSYDYNLVGNLPYVIKGEQIIHQFTTSSGNDGHSAQSPERYNGEVIASVDGPAMDCSAPPVSLGEVMAGFQAGYTAGSHNDFGPAGSHFIAATGEDRRGFVVPEGIDSSQQCENDFILVGGYVGATIALPDGTRVRPPKRAIDIVNAGLNGFIVSQRFEIDGVTVEHVSTAAKIGYLPNGRRAAIIGSGIIMEPYSLSQGLHSAAVIYSLDFFPRDGIPDFDYVVSTTIWINAAPDE